MIKLVLFLILKRKFEKNNDFLHFSQTSSIFSNFIEISRIFSKSHEILTEFDDLKLSKYFSKNQV